MEKLLNDIGVSQDSAWSLILECTGLASARPVLKLTPLCSHTLASKWRVVIPTYADAHCAQLNLYTKDDCISAGSLSLYLKNEPIVKLEDNIMTGCISGKNFENKLQSSLFSLSECCPKYGNDM